MKLSNGFTTESIGSAMVVRFTRPEVRNPLSVDVLEGLFEVFSVVSKRAVVFTGADDVFASGADLREIAKVTGTSAADFADRGQRLMNLIAASKAKTVAAINGFCFGGALDLSIACHSRIGSPQAEFCHPGAGLGIMTGWGGTQRLPRLIGEAAALEMFLSGKRVDASHALRIGLLDAIVADPLAVAIESCL